MISSRGKAYLVLMFLLLATSVGPKQTAAQSERCFAETGFCISGRFRSYWEQQGGLAVFGYPLTAAQQELNQDTGRHYLTQWFERVRFELHPEHAAPYDVLLGRIGEERLLQQGRDWNSMPKDPPSVASYFPETGFGVKAEFAAYWSRHGLELGDSGVSYRESLARFGFPISSPAYEINSSGDRVITQWFERARFEYHPDQPEPYTVLLGRLGAEVRVGAGHAPASGRISFGIGDPEMLRGDIYTVNPDGSQLSPIVRDVEGFFDWSPDRKKLLYVQCLDVPEGPSCINSAISLLDVSSGASRRISDGVGHTSRPVWSPDGRKIAFAFYRQDGPAIHVTGADGSGLVRLADGAEPQWSPDGALLLYSTIVGGKTLVMRMKADGTEQRLLAEGREADWAPDGRIAYVAINNKGANIIPEIVVMQADGAGKQRLAQGTSPVWSPDGHRIAYVTAQASGLGDIYITSDDGRWQRQLTRDPGHDSNPAWSPDGNFIVFTSNRGGHSIYDAPLYVIRTDATQEQRITDKPALLPTWLSS